MSLEDLAVIVATALAWWSLIPQIRRLARTGDASGVSTTWPAIGLVSNAAWTAYLLSAGLWAAAPSTAVMVVFYALVFRALAMAHIPLRVAGLRGAAWSAALASVFMVGSWPALGLVLGWAYIPQLAPAVWSAWRTPEPVGVSPGTWALIGVEAVLWAVYGLAKGDTPVVIYAAVGVTAAVLILVRIGTTVGFAGSRAARSLRSPAGH